MSKQRNIIGLIISAAIFIGSCALVISNVRTQNYAVSKIPAVITDPTPHQQSRPKSTSLRFFAAFFAYLAVGVFLNAK